MTDYTELVKALRCGEYKPECGSSDCPYWSGLGCMDGQLMEDASDAIEALQANVKRLKEANDELREAQTYIDHYGDKWLTSAKDVPTAAYEHGYADGRAEAEVLLPKRGEIVRCKECIHFTQGGWCDREFEWFPVEENDFCSMAEKMEVQDDS